MVKKTGRKVNIKAIIIITLIVFSIGSFSVDFIRVKNLGLEPICSVQIIDYGNGSVDYYGAGYKIWKDYHPADETTKYYMGFWFVPKFINI